jgi:hypothetical protein
MNGSTQLIKSKKKGRNYNSKTVTVATRRCIMISFHCERIEILKTKSILFFIGLNRQKKKKISGIFNFVVIPLLA